jgi:hypothetical protein
MTTRKILIHERALKAHETTRDYEVKCIRVIESCKTSKQLESALKVCKSFNRMFTGQNCQDLINKVFETFILKEKNTEPFR